MISLHVAAIVGVAAAASQPKTLVTFSRDVAPLLFSHCSGCHRPGGSGPFDLLTYASARQHARQIADVTARRVMPPWKVEPGYGAFVGRQPLSDAEIALLEEWVADGALEGDPRELPIRPRWSVDWQLGTPDLVVDSGPGYTLGAAGGDTFRVFVLRIPIAATRYVVGLEFRPSNPRVVHHANILLDHTPTSRQRNDEDPTLGEQGLLSATAAYPPGHFLGWTPGQPDPLLTESLAWQLEPNTDLVVQLHLKPSGKPELVQFRVGFFFGTKAPDRTPAVLRLSRQNLDIAAEERHYLATDSYQLPVDVDVLAIKPHAHYRAREVRAFATLPSGETQWLLFIKDWDFQWQHTYRYVTPVRLPRGAWLRMEYLYDNGAHNPRNPVVPPTRVRWGPRSFDEMADLWIQVAPRTSAESAALTRDFRRKWAADDLVGYEAQIETSPNVVVFHQEAALLALELGRTAVAVNHLEAAIQIRPASAPAHFNLGVALMQSGRPAQAIREYEEALRIDPLLPAAHNNLGNVFAAQGRLNEAYEQYRQVLALQPSHAGASNNVGFILLNWGRLDEAVPFLLQALRLEPTQADAHFNLGLVLQQRGQPEALARFREAATLRPDWPSPLLSLSWALSTSSDESLRNPTEAVVLAERAVALTAGRDARALDVLAAAYAVAGRFDEALDTIAGALALSVDSPATQALRARQDLYRQHRLYLEPRR